MDAPTNNTEKQAGGKAPDETAGRAGRDRVRELFAQREISMPLGVVMRRRPGVTRWQKWIWSVTAVLPGATRAEWQELRREGEAVEYHAATVTLALHRAETEGYRVSLAMTPPSVFVILDEPDESGRPQVHQVTASAFEAQDHADAGDQEVAPVPMPPGLIAWVQEFVDAHVKEERFRKRRRDKARIDRRQDGIGDARVRQPADVYRAPAGLKPGGGPGGGTMPESGDE